MKINKHHFINDHCLHCGALFWPKVQKQFSDRGEAVPQEDTRSCVSREDYTNPHDLRPEPKARTYACDDNDSIKAALDKLREAYKPIEADLTYCWSSELDLSKPYPWALEQYFADLNEKVVELFKKSNVRKPVTFNKIAKEIMQDYPSHGINKLLHLSEKSIG